MAENTSTRAAEPLAPDPTAPDARLFVASVSRAMRILETFNAERPSLSIANIAELTGMGRSAVQRFVYTLNCLGYLRKNPITRHYEVTHRVINLSSSLSGVGSIAASILPTLQDMVRETRETMAYVELDNIDIIVLKSVGSPQLSSVNLPVGRRFNAISSSSGQVILAHRSPEDILRIFNLSTDHARQRVGFSTGYEMVSYLARVKTDGYALTEKLEDQHSLSLSVPVRDVAHQVVGALNLSTLKSRHSKDSLKRHFLHLMLENASKLHSRQQALSHAG